jgi:hypothetical protein
VNTKPTQLHFATLNYQTYFYNHPDYNASRVKYVQPGTSLWVSGFAGAWARVDRPLSGWVPLRDITYKGG